MASRLGRWAKIGAISIIWGLNVIGAGFLLRDYYYKTQVDKKTEIIAGKLSNLYSKISLYEDEKRNREESPSRNKQKQENNIFRFSKESGLKTEEIGKIETLVIGLLPANTEQYLKDFEKEQLRLKYTRVYAEKDAQKYGRRVDVLNYPQFQKSSKFILEQDVLISPKKDCRIGTILVNNHEQLSRECDFTLKLLDILDKNYTNYMTSEKDR